MEIAGLPAVRAKRSINPVVEFHHVNKGSQKVTNLGCRGCVPCNRYRGPRSRGLWINDKGHIVVGIEVVNVLFDRPNHCVQIGTYSLRGTYVLIRGFGEPDRASDVRVYHYSLTLLIYHFALPEPVRFDSEASLTNLDVGAYPRKRIRHLHCAATAPEIQHIFVAHVERRVLS